MGHEHEGDAHLLLQLTQLYLHLLSQLLVERPQRFVQEQHLRLLDERSRQRDPLPLASGQLACPALPVSGQPYQLQHFLDALRELPLREPGLAHAERDVGRDIQMREYRVALEHHVHRAVVGRNERHVLAVDVDAPAARHLEAGEHAEQGRFPATRRSEQRKELSLRDLEVCIVHRPDRTEILGDVVDGDDRLGHRLRPWVG